MAPDDPSSRYATAPLPSEPAQEGFVRLGVVVGAHGLRGEIKVRVDNPESESFAALQRLYLSHRGVTAAYPLLSTARINRRFFKLSLEGIRDRSRAEELTGASVNARIEDLPPPAPSEFYYFQVMGATVRTSDNRILGTVTNVFFSGAHDVLVVRSDTGEFMLPVVSDIVHEIDTTNRSITVSDFEAITDAT